MHYPITYSHCFHDIITLNIEMISPLQEVKLLYPNLSLLWFFNNVYESRKQFDVNNEGFSSLTHSRAKYGNLFKKGWYQFKILSIPHTALRFLTLFSPERWGGVEGGGGVTIKFIEKSITLTSPWHQIENRGLFALISPHPPPVTHMHLF